MIGILSYGIYIPRYRLSRQEIARAWRSPSMGGEKAVCNFDEDSITMAVAAAQNCLGDPGGQGADRLYFASTTAPYREKQSAALVAAACDLPPSIRTADFGDSLRAGTSAFEAALDAARAGSASRTAVVAADCRMAEPESPLEQLVGDAAAALLVGEGDPIAIVEESLSVTEEFTGTWRREKDPFIRQTGAKFNLQYGYTGVVVQTIRRILESARLGPHEVDRLVLHAPDTRSQAAVARAAGFDVKAQLTDDLLGKVGDAGTPAPLLGLAAALESAGPGETLLWVSYGDGCDAYLLRTTETIVGARPARGVAAYLARGVPLGPYERYAQFRQFLGSEQPQPSSSTVLLWRERQQDIRLYGVRCRGCGRKQYPMNRVCVVCGKKDDFTEEPLARTGEVFTYTLDHLAYWVEPPTPRAVVQLEDGARIFLEVTDCEPRSVAIGMPVELTFRRMHEGADFHNYYWKACPPITA